MDESRKNRRMHERTAPQVRAAVAKAAFEREEYDSAAESPQLEVMMSSNQKPNIKGKFKTYQHSCFMVIGVIGQ